MIEIEAILSDWDSVRVTHYTDLVAIAGVYRGVAHSGARADGISLAHDLARIAKAPIDLVAVEPVVAPVDPYEAHWEAVTSGTLVDAVAAPVFEEPTPAPIDPRDAELDALRARIAELEAAPILELSNEPPAEALMEAYPDEDHVALKARILAEFASLRNMLVGHIPMTMEQLARLQALEHPRFQTWLQA
jgi:hypothetical protein